MVGMALEWVRYFGGKPWGQYIHRLPETYQGQCVVIIAKGIYMEIYGIGIALALTVAK